MNTTREFITFSPYLAAEDVLANYWLRQVTVRLRREICWRWYLQEGITVELSATTLPPLKHKLTDALDISRYWEAKCQFYQNEPTAKYLTDLLVTEAPIPQSLVRGSFSWVVEKLALNEVSTFILALGLIVTFDNAVSEVIAACLNDSTATHPNLALAQKLWERPEEILAIADPEHPLWRYGLLQSTQEAHSIIGVDWHSPLVVPPLVAQHLLFPHSPLPQVLVPLGQAQGVPTPGDRAHQVALRLYHRADTLQIVPIQTLQGAIPTEVVQGISQLAQRQVVALKGNPILFENRTYLKSLVTLCWLKELDLFIPSHGSEGKEGEKSRYLFPLQEIAIAIFLSIRDRQELSHLPSHLLLPIIKVPQLAYSDRVRVWQEELGTTNLALKQTIAECSRRFRYEKGTIHSICTGLAIPDAQISPADLFAACRAELDLNIGELAQVVTPRFEAAELVLPPKQQALFEDIYQAMKSLTQVHYEWGTAKAWNECGISVLFAGLPGTGKTMAAEILAAKLGLPMYRIDLSQVVNKYIGETEKNLKRLFDAADISDTLLFFDEADALFGRRTEVKDAHDRYANLEISYLLERMERFKGLAILATNRKKDLDEAFLRRLRYILDFPLPDIRERYKIWQQAIPSQVDASALDFEFLAKQFPLAGGHIRSIVFNACLQIAGSASGSTGMGGAGDEEAGEEQVISLNTSPYQHSIPNPQLTMAQIMVCIKREYDKLNRSVSLEQFGAYAKLIESINRQ
ncbi:MAG TPA: ATP-binding protein [Cyanobacteria bacterium UBA8803]|nr:ATP-binding protein [Cyanobacteria bacterium UBA9273]HBL57099.1 ATP-binding protein [Cyanobacteria bacterium UBA8803]